MRVVSAKNPESLFSPAAAGETASKRQHTPRPTLRTGEGSWARTAHFGGGGHGDDGVAVVLQHGPRHARRWRVVVHGELAEQQQRVLRFSSIRFGGVVSLSLSREPNESRSSYLTQPASSLFGTKHAITSPKSRILHGKAVAYDTYTSGCLPTTTDSASFLAPTFMSDLAHRHVALAEVWLTTSASRVPST